MSNPAISIEDFVAPAKEPHPLTPTVTALINAGPSKVATAKFDTEDEAKTFIREMQSAAREQNVSARKRALAQDGKKWVVSVSVGARIVRNRKAKEAVTAE